MSILTRTQKLLEQMRRGETPFIGVGYVQEVEAALRAAHEPSALRSGLERAIEIVSKVDPYTAQGARASGLINADISTADVMAFQYYIVDKLDEAIGASPPPERVPAPVREWIEDYSRMLAVLVNRAFASGAQTLDADVADTKHRLTTVDQWLRATETKGEG